MRFFVTLSEPIDPQELRKAWEEQARLNPSQPRVDFIRIGSDGGLEAEALDPPPNWHEDFRRILAQVLLRVDDFCTIRDIYHVGLKKRLGTE